MYIFRLRLFPPFLGVVLTLAPPPPSSPTRRCPTNRFILLKIDFLPPSKFLDRNHYYSFLSSLSSLSPLPIRPFFSRYSPETTENVASISNAGETSVWGSNNQRSCYEDIAAAQRFRVQPLPQNGHENLDCRPICGTCRL